MNPAIRPDLCKIRPDCRILKIFIYFSFTAFSWVYTPKHYLIIKCLNISSPRGSEGRPDKILRPLRAKGAILYICNNSGAVFRQSFLVVSNCSYLLKLRIRAHLANMTKLRRRPHVEIWLRKKVTALWNSRNWPVMRDLSDWLTDWLTTDWPLTASFLPTG